MSEERPWEQPDAVRRDCEPRRAPALLVLGVVSAALGALGALLALAAVLSGWSSPPSLFAGLGVAWLLPVLSLSGGVAWSASRDLDRMRQGQVDPSGRGMTHAAGGVGALVFVLGLLALDVLVASFYRAFLRGGY